MASEYFGTSEPPAENPYDGAFSVTCGGGSAGNVTVSFSLSGAVYGAAPYDYTLSCSEAVITVASDGLSGTIVMPGDGPTTATIYVIPNDLGIVGGDGKTITMTLTSSTAYNVVSGWSGAMVMINDDDPPTSSPPWDWADPQITAFTPAGAATSTTLAAPESAPVGDFIPVEIFIPAGSASSTVYVLDTTSAISISSIPGDTEYAGSPGTLDGPSYGSLGPGQGYYQMLYVYATDSAATTDVTATITLEQASGGAYFTPVSAFVDFKPLQIFNNGANITGTAPTIKIGQMMSLQVQDPSGRGGLVAWSMPSGTTVKNYQPTNGPNGAALKASKLEYLTTLDLFAQANGANSVANVAPAANSRQFWAFFRMGQARGSGSGPTDSVTAVLANPFGEPSAGLSKFFSPKYGRSPTL